MSRPTHPDCLVGGGEMGVLMRAHQWQRTPLGLPETWPQALRSAIGICLNTRFPIAIYWGPELALVYNDPWSPIPGVKHPWALGRPARDVWPEIWDTIGPMFERVAATGEGTYSEDQLLPMRRRGFTEECYFNFTFSPIRDNNGVVSGVFNAVVETTYRVIDERRTHVLRELAHRASAARSTQEACNFSAAALGPAMTDVPFCLVYLLDEGGKTARLASSAGLDGDIPMLVELDSDGAAWPFAAAALSGCADLVEDISDALGVLSPLGPWPEPVRQALVAPLAMATGAGERPVGFLVTGVSPRLAPDTAYQAFVERAAGHIASAIANARAHEEERRRNEMLAELDRTKTAFFANISHEFRTPLTLMLGPLEQMLSDPGQVRAEERQRVEIAHRNALRLLRLVNSLLDFSRVEVGRMQARYESVDLAALTAELASGFRSLCDQAGLQLDVNCPPLPAETYVDREMWEKIVLNLLSNAFKFTFEGSLFVGLHPSADKAGVVLTVGDTGTGIPAAELPRLFERFYRVEGAQGRSFEGSGIGLALVHDLVGLHGGKVEAQSKPGTGSTFTVTIPSGRSHLPPDRVSSGPAQAASSASQAFVEEAQRWLQGPDASVGASMQSLPEELAGAKGTGPGQEQGLVLLVDDNADMRDYLYRLLTGRGYQVVATSDGEMALQAAQQSRPDLVLSDVMMPRLNGFGLLRALRADPVLSEIPVVLLSARAGEEAGVEGLDAGADDYLVKPFSARELLARVQANLSLARVRREAVDAVRTRSAELEAVIATVPAAVWFTRDAEARRVQGNRRAEELLRLPVDTNPSLFWPGSKTPAFQVFRGNCEALAETLPIQRAAKGAEVRGEELTIRFPDGTFIVLLCQATPLKDGKGQVTGAVCAAVDITEQKAIAITLQHANDALEERVTERTAALVDANRRLQEEAAERERAEEQLRQSQKMEAVGQLTGGLAHDFNNLLTGIMGSLELLQARVAQGRINDVDRYVNAAQGAARRAAALTHRLLAFSRRQTLDPRPVDVNRLIAGIEELIGRTMGPEINIEPVAGVGLWSVLVDPSQLENALLNLCINARDAMPGGGKLSIETANRWLDERAAKQRDIPPGQYVSLCVSDNGTGMPPDVIKRAFDPFFTTKPIGQGTGLGLSMIYGFVRQSGGQVRIYSEMGQGTMVCLYLPRHLGPTETGEQVAELSEAPRAEQGETVLVVDDEPTVRMLVTEVLEDLGYTAIEATDGAAGLKVLVSNVRVDLLVTDVGLPGGMNGRQLADAARTSRPDLKVLFITGYAENAVLSHGHLGSGMQMMTKPFAMEALATRIRSLIEEGPTSRKGA